MHTAYCCVNAHFHLYERMTESYLHRFAEIKRRKDTGDWALRVAVHSGIGGEDLSQETHIFVHAFIPSFS